MKRAIIVAAGDDIEGLTAEVQAVANEFSGAGWTVRLLCGNDASRAGLLQAAEKRFDLAWLGMHSNAEGFGLTDGIMPAAELGQWLCHIGAKYAVLNSCFSAEHVSTIQRAAPSLACSATIDPGGINVLQAWSSGVYLARDFIEGGDLQAATDTVSGGGLGQYRYFPAVGRARRTVINDQDILRQLTEALAGSTLTGEPGLFVRLNKLAIQLEAFIAEQQKTNAAQAQSNSDMDRRLRLLEARQPLQMSAKEVAASVLFVLVVAVVILFLAAKFGGIT